VNEHNKAFMLHKTNRIETCNILHTIVSVFTFSSPYVTKTTGMTCHELLGK